MAAVGKRPVETVPAASGAGEPDKPVDPKNVGKMGDKEVREISGREYDRAYQIFNRQYNVLVEIYAIVVLLNILPTPDAVKMAFFGDHETRLYSIADIGGGTGVTIDRVRGIIRRCLQPFYSVGEASHPKYLLVEPSQHMATRAIQAGRVRCDEVVIDDAKGFSSGADTRTFDIVILQQMVHHIEDWAGFFKEMWDKLRPGGIIIVDTRPRKTEFPFGDHAHRTWRSSYKSMLPPESILLIAKELGAKIDFHLMPFHLTMSKEEWIKVCYGTETGFDLFSNIVALSEDEKTDDIAQVQREYPSTVRIKDTHLLIFMRKPKPGEPSSGGIFPIMRAKL